MFRRGESGPMDWEYQNRLGPISDSPFGELARQSQDKNGGKKGTTAPTPFFTIKIYTTVFLITLYVKDITY